MSFRKPGVTHELKILPDFFVAVKSLRKTAEIRFDDRDFMIGDWLLLKEWKPRKKQFTGRQVLRKITDITRLCRVIEEIEDPCWVVLHMGAFHLEPVI